MKTITAVLMDPELDKPAIDAAIKIARRNEAHLDLICLGLDRTQPGFYYAGANAMVLQDNLAQVRDEAEKLEVIGREMLAGSEFSWSATGVATSLIALNGVIAHRVRFSDLVVLPRPYGAARGHEYEAIVEAAMFNGDVPVLIQPDDKPFPDTWDNVVVAWNESPEALRAVRAAMPALEKAKNVNITIIDPPQHGPDRSDPGGALSQMLARRGVRTEVSVLARTMPRISDILCRQATDIGADLIVMGAYGHSRFRESILGGATRHMLELANVPVILAH